MKRTLINADINSYPPELRSLLEGARIYDSSCSPEARVIFVDKGEGYYLKSAPKDTLSMEAQMTGYFHKKGLGTEVVDYINTDRDWLVTRRVSGEDCTHKSYLDEPERLCDLLAAELYRLHHTDFADCPVPNRIDGYLKTARDNYHSGKGDLSLFSGAWGFESIREAWEIVDKYGHLLKNDCLIHGDFCLPNLFLQEDRVSGYLDLGFCAVADRYQDIALCYRSLLHNADGTYGPTYPNIFPDRLFSALGMAPDWEKVRYYRLLDELF